MGKSRTMPQLRSGDRVAVLTAGAYGYSMSSNYNCRLKPAEALVDGTEVQTIRERQRVEDLLLRQSKVQVAIPIAS
jgi:diaminopimelate decarboxylase